MLLVVALFTSYTLQQRKIQAVHETVLSIFAGGFTTRCRLCLGLSDVSLGMIVGLALRLSGSSFIQSVVSFDYQFFFNLLLPPIILASGYELHQVGNGSNCSLNFTDAECRRIFSATSALY